VTTSMTALYAGIPVTDRDAALRWYESFFGRPADEVVAAETLWAISDHAWVVVEEQPDRPGGGLLTIGIGGVDAWSRGSPRRHRTRAGRDVPNGVRHLTVLGPDGNSLSFAEGPNSDLVPPARGHAVPPTGSLSHRSCDRLQRGPWSEPSR
jgi:catechol 2,3-dioxygenase-like lactoylglutathione lyase family enzyme